MFTATAQTQPLMNQIKVDFQNTKNRVMVAQVMKANGFSKEEVLQTMEDMKKNTSDLADMILAQLID